LRLFSFGGYGLALAVLALVVFGAIECPSLDERYLAGNSSPSDFLVTVDLVQTKGPMKKGLNKCFILEVILLNMKYHVEFL